MSATPADGARPPFEGLRVLDFTRYYAGPFAAWQLALLGADVIKIEPPGGEEIRSGSTHPEWGRQGMAPNFVGINSNKRSLTLDLTKPEAVEVVRRLVRDADVVVENFRPGVMARFGLGWDALSALNPRLIYCAVSGFGQTGPERGTAAFDGKIQAMSGIMSITGAHEHGPMRAGFPICDMIGGMTGAFGLASALYQRERTGRGQLVDVAMLDSALNFLAPMVAEATLAGHRSEQMGNLSVTRKATADLFRCGDGWLMLAVLTERQYTNLMRAIGRADALDDARFADWSTRAEHRDALHAIIEQALAEGAPKDWEAKLTAADVPCSTVWHVDEIIGHPAVRHRGFVQTVQTPMGPMALAGAGFTLSDGTARITRGAPRAGEHTDEVLRAAGYAEAEIAALRRDGVV
ncbi:MAG TPA: CoA transferase [Quisquiliibacterium sp.]|nr:CoA transferase [Quisquiliibacterium sp.]